MIVLSVVETLCIFTYKYVVGAGPKRKRMFKLLSTVEWKDLRYADIPDDVVSGSFSVSKTNNVFLITAP